MASSTQFFIPLTTHQTEETIKKSRFISRIIPVNNAEQARQEIQNMRNEFADARHHCSAFVAGAPHDSNQYGFSDDGEPSGTAGKPMLAVLQGSGLGHVLAVVVRYSGGIKLGTGGLVKAYGGGVKQALIDLPTELKVIKEPFGLNCTYQQWPQIEFWLQQYDADITSVQYHASVELQLALNQVGFDNLQLKLNDMQLKLKSLQ